MPKKYYLRGFPAFNYFKYVANSNEYNHLYFIGHPITIINSLTYCVCFEPDIILHSRDTKVHKLLSHSMASIYCEIYVKETGKNNK